MALSDEEQRLLEQMEAALAAEDPKLVNALRGTGVRGGSIARAAALLASDSSPAWGSSSPGSRSIRFLSVLGFVIMVAAAVTAIYSWQHVGGSADAGQRRDRAKTSRARAPIDGQGFMDKMEERWRRRRDEGF